MKIYIYITILVVFCLGSCQKHVLDKVPLNIITDQQVWTDSTLMDAYLTQQYAYTAVFVQDATGYVDGWGPCPISGTWDFGTSEQSSGPMFMNEIADEAMGGWAYFGTSDIFKTQGIHTAGGFSEWWEYPYAIFRALNQFIQTVPTVSPSVMSPGKVKLRVAEARFIRAFNYFSMVKRYGGVPLITKVVPLNGTKDQLYPQRNTEQQIYDFVISEMDSVAPVLAATTDYGRPNMYAALALKCRAALYAGSISEFGTVQLNGLLGIPSSLSQAYYQKAYDAANSIITSGKYALYNSNSDKIQNFKNIFLVKQNSEAIFAKQHNGVDAVQAGGNAWSYDFMQCPHPQAWGAGMKDAPYLEMAEEFEHVDGTPGALDRNAVQQGLWSTDSLWANKDPRFYATIWTQNTAWKGGHVDFHNGLIDPNGNILSDPSQGYGGINAWGDQTVDGTFHTSFGVMKYLDENADNMTWLSRSSTDYLVFRYGEVLLNFAEAAFELGKTSDALKSVNQIRARAGIALLTTITRDQIRHERKVELAFEGHRYWDLRRWRIATSVLNNVSHSGIRYILDYTTRKYKIQILNNIDGANTPPIFTSNEYYFPITLTRTSANTNLVENPGY